MDKELLLRYIEGNVTDQEKEEITVWLDSDHEHMKEYLALHKLNDITLWQEVPSEKSILRPGKQTISWSWKRIYTESLKIAALFLLAFWISHYFFTGINSTEPVVMQSLHVPAGQRAELTLTDGTKVWLNAKTTLVFPNKFSDQNREVALNGEGYFIVSKNKNKPFIVKTEKYDVKVWGTEFNLMAYSGKGIFETSLLEGSVEVMKAGNPKGILIRPEERAYLDNDQLIIAPILHMNHFLWKDGIISFNDESFWDIVKKLELYFDLKIEVKNNEILNYRCTGKFRTKDGVDHILRVLQLSNTFKFKVDDKLNIITIE